MNDFNLYFSIGWKHIISTDALDHILFVMALAAIYLLRDWKKVLILVTAFTVGHSLTLALSVYDVIRMNASLVELLIPITILITAVFNLFQKDFSPRNLRLNYFFALFFGLIHGMGFANSIRFMLAKDDSIGWPLFSFNLGLEAGQLLVVFVILFLAWLLVSKLNLPRKIWVYLISIPAIIVSLQMIFERG